MAQAMTVWQSRWVWLAFGFAFATGFLLGAALAVILIVQVAISYAQ